MGGNATALHASQAKSVVSPGKAFENWAINWAVIRSPRRGADEQLRCLSMGGPAASTRHDVYYPSKRSGGVLKFVFREARVKRAESRSAR